MDIRKTDSKGRLSLAKFGFTPGQSFRVTRSGTTVILEPVTSYTRSELEEKLCRGLTDEQWEAML